MALLSYKEVRPWAKAIKASVVSRKMPPWFADPNPHAFSNDRHLTGAEINTLVTWANTGAPEGSKRDAPPPLSFHSGWNLKPDLVVEVPKPVPLPASGTINYRFILVKANFPNDMWVKAAEMRAGNSKVLHHGKVWVRPPSSHWMEHAVPGQAYDDLTQRDIIAPDQMNRGNEVLGKFNPGLGAQRFDLDGSAKFVPKGSDLVFEMHYTAAGQPETDQSKLGIEIERNPPANRYLFSIGPANYGLVIPPGESNVEITSEATVLTDCRLAYIQPHMHLRGKDYELRLVYPDGKTETVFKGKFDFAWQLGYNFADPVPLPKGTRIVGIAHFDNSPNNPFNPDPKKEVRWGPQNADEMSNGFLGLIFDAKLPPDSVIHLPGPGLGYRLGKLWDSLR